MKKFSPLAACLCAWQLFSCSVPERDSPYDPKGINYGAVSCNMNYRTVVIGTQTWMAENLNCDVAGSKCYNNDPANCAKYGRLYNWQQAMVVCPSGWRLPSNADWDKLMTAVGGSSTAGRYLKATSGWYNNGNGNDGYGFSALPGGYGNSDGSFYDVGNFGNWWSSSEYNSNYAYSRNMRYSLEDVYYYNDSKYYLQSVRCLQD